MSPVNVEQQAHPSEAGDRDCTRAAAFNSPTKAAGATSRQARSTAKRPLLIRWQPCYVSAPSTWQEEPAVQSHTVCLAHHSSQVEREQKCPHTEVNAAVPPQQYCRCTAVHDIMINAAHLELCSAAEKAGDVYQNEGVVALASLRRLDSSSAIAMHTIYIHGKGAI